MNANCLKITDIELKRDDPNWVFNIPLTEHVKTKFRPVDFIVVARFDMIMGMH